MGWFERLLRRLFPHRELGWEDIGEKFTRFTLVKTRWFQVFLHKLQAPNPHPQCHDHPWSFVAVILRGGYWEYAGGKWARRPPGRVLWRPAEFTHNVVTRGTSWSVIFATRKFRGWALKGDCRSLPEGVQ
jgi:hypothetical protein